MLFINGLLKTKDEKSFSFIYYGFINSFIQRSTQVSDIRHLLFEQKPPELKSR